MTTGIFHPGRLRLSALAGFVLALAGGCGGGGKGDLNGTVTFNGKPVTSGTVQVFGPNGFNTTSPIGLDGSYALKDVPAGAVTLGVSSPHPQRLYEQLKMMAKTEEAKKALPVPDPATIASWVGIPDSFAQSGTSGLTATVNKGPNKHDIPITGTAVKDTGPAVGTTGLPKAKEK